MSGFIGEIGLLLRPRLWPVLNRGLSRSTRGGAARLLVLAARGPLSGGAVLDFLAGAALLPGIEDIGDLLAYKLLSMILIVSSRCCCSAAS